MSYSCLEELQTVLDLHMSDKTSVLSDAGYKYKNKWFVITNDGYCYLFDKDGNLDNVSKIKYLTENMIKKDIKKIIIPDSVISIENFVFDRCTSLISVAIPNSVTSIENYAFWGCSSLPNVMIPNSVTSIGAEAFACCSSLISIIIPNSVTSMGYEAFCYCSSLTNVTIPNSVTGIGENAFYNCSNLKSLIFKSKTLDQVKAMKNYPFGIEDESIIKCVE